VNLPQHARRVAVDEQLAGRHLPGWDYADAYACGLPPGASADPDDLARALLGAGSRRQRRLVHLLMRGRDRLGRLVGLKPAARRPGALFPVLAKTPDLIVMGLNDRHLDFRLLLARQEDQVVVTTLVQRHNTLGTAYFALVGPFHRTLVPRLLDSASSRDWNGACRSPQVPPDSRGALPPGQ
jgi:hypothetical protein